MLAIALLFGVEAAAGSLSAEQAMANYRSVLHAAIAPPAGADCRTGKPGEIVVCGRHDDSSQRLPLPDERGGEGDRAFHTSEPSSSVGAMDADGYHCGHTSCDPPQRLGETIGKAIGVVRSLFTGEDPTGP